MSNVNLPVNILQHLAKSRKIISQNYLASYLAKLSRKIISQVILQILLAGIFDVLLFNILYPLAHEFNNRTLVDKPFGLFFQIVDRDPPGFFFGGLVCVRIA